MSTPNAPIAVARRAGTRVSAVAAALLATGTLAAGCGTTHAGAPSGGPAPTASATATSAVPSASAAPSASFSSSSASAVPSGPAGSSGAAGSSGPAAPVPTVSGGRVTPGEPACAGWPASAPTASLPVSFVPVAVERCVNGAQTIPGKGLWQTASLQRADSGLDALVSALHQPPGRHQPGTACPMLAIIPQQIVLISATGQELIPRLPVSGCGLVQPQVLAALDTLPWRLVSVRLIAAIPEASGTGTVP
jgi:hypothetical protein